MSESRTPRHRRVAAAVGAAFAATFVAVVLSGAPGWSVATTGDEVGLAAPAVVAGNTKTTKTHTKKPTTPPPTKTHTKKPTTPPPTTPPPTTPPPTTTHTVKPTTPKPTTSVLPVTGSSEATLLAIVAAGALVAGTGLIFVGRQRRAKEN